MLKLSVTQRDSVLVTLVAEPEYQFFKLSQYYLVRSVEFVE